ncbi:MAG: hypothetical protein AAGE94_02195 [Acidobacteriota bacterium]
MSRDLISCFVRRFAHTTTNRIGITAILVVLAITGSAQAQLVDAQRRGIDRWTSGLICQQIDAEPGALFVETRTTAPTVRTLYLAADGARFEPPVLAAGDGWTIVQIEGPVRVCAVAWDRLPHAGLDLRLRPVPGGAWAVADPIEIDPDGAVADPIEIDPDGAVADPIEIDPDGYRVARTALW